MAIQFIEAGKMDTSFRKLNSMLSLWYGIIAGSLQVYLIVQNVWKFVRFAELPWPTEQTPTLELNIFIGLNGFAVLLLPFFVTACFLKIGNMANDNEMIGKRLRCTRNWMGNLVDSRKNQESVFVSMWTHSGPISSLLHILCSVCLLFPQTLMDGILIKHGFLPKDNVWKSDLDFLNTAEPEDDMVIRPIGESGLSDFAKRVIPLTSKQDGLRLEFINYAMALFIFTFRYAQVFWFAHKRFAVVFGLQQILNNIHSLVSFSTLIVLYKIHVAGVYQKSTPFLLDSQMTMLIFAITLTVLFASSSVLYYLGYLKFSTCLHDKMQKQYSNGSADSSFYGGSWAYFPHSAAVSIALALAAAQSPLVHDAFIVHQISSRTFLLALPICSVVHFLLWAILWLCLTLKKTWNFDINATVIQPIDGLETHGLPTEITIDLGESCPPGPFSPSLVVISEGKAFSVDNAEDQKSILALIPQKEKTDQTYWKKTTPTPTPSCLSYKHKGDKIKYMPCRKEVTFDDELVSPRYYSRPPSRVDKMDSRSDNCCSNTHVEDFDAGEYAYLSGSRNHPQICKQNHNGSQRNSRAEPLYGQLPSSISFMERSTVASPVSTVESSSGVSSLSGQSACGPPSTSASCSQFSIGETHQHQRDSVVEPSAHYEPVRMPLSRRNSMRSYVTSPCQGQVSQDESIYQKRLVEDLYGKLGGSRAASVCRSESIYSVGSKKASGSTSERFNQSMYEHNSCNISGNGNSKFLNEPLYVSSKSNSNANCHKSDNSKIYGHIDDICPPIPPPLPILSCVVRKNYSVQSPQQIQADEELM